MANSRSETRNTGQKRATSLSNMDPQGSIDESALGSIGGLASIDLPQDIITLDDSATGMNSSPHHIPPPNYHHHQHYQHHQHPSSPQLPVAPTPLSLMGGPSSVMPSRRDSMVVNASLPPPNIYTNIVPEEDNDDSDDEIGRDKRSGRRKIRIEYIEDKSRRHITFSKRKAGIMKKAYELSTLTGTQVLLLVASETGHVYTFATPKLQPLITKPEGKNLIQACLNAPDTCPTDFNQNPTYDGDEEQHHSSGGKEGTYDDTVVNAPSASAISANYAAAMAGLAGLYPSSSSNQAASSAFLNPSHYPAAYAAAQYNAALAAGYWPSTSTGGGNAPTGHEEHDHADSPHLISSSSTSNQS